MSNLRRLPSAASSSDNATTPATAVTAADKRRPDENLHRELGADRRDDRRSGRSDRTPTWRGTERIRSARGCQRRILPSTTTRRTRRSTWRARRRRTRSRRANRQRGRARSRTPPPRPDAGAPSRAAARRSESRSTRATRAAAEACSAATIRIAQTTIVRTAPVQFMSRGVRMVSGDRVAPSARRVASRAGAAGGTVDA